MWQKGGGMFCCGVEEKEEVEKEKEDDDSNIDPDYKDNYDHGYDWDLDEFVAVDIGLAAVA